MLALKERRLLRLDVQKDTTKYLEESIERVYKQLTATMFIDIDFIENDLVEFGEFRLESRTLKLTDPAIINPLSKLMFRDTYDIASFIQYVDTDMVYEHGRVRLKAVTPSTEFAIRMIFPFLKARGIDVRMIEDSGSTFVAHLTIKD